MEKKRNENVKTTNKMKLHTCLINEYEPRVGGFRRVAMGKNQNFIR